MITDDVLRAVLQQLVADPRTVMLSSQRVVVEAWLKQVKS